MTEHRALCGWLMKKDAKSLWKGWKKRWFQQLHDYHLYYFPSCTTDVSLSKGYIDMKLILHVQADPTQKEKNVFNIITQDRTYVLQANSPDEVEYWIAGLNATVASLSQPLTALISKAELFEIQQQHIKDQERRGPSRTVSAYNLSITKKDLEREREKEKEKERHPRAASVRYPSLIPSDSSGEMKLARSNSLQNLAPNLQSAPNLQNITYIDNYNAETSAADSSILPSSSSSSFSSSIPNANSEYLSSSPSLSSLPTNQQFTPPSVPFVGGSKSTPVTPIKPASASMPFLDILANKSTREQDVEKEKQEKKKWASMKDMQALILREKEAEIARLVIEVARVNEMHEKAIESQKVIRQEVLMQLEQHRMEDAQKILEIEAKYNKQIEELNNTIKNKDKEIEQLKEDGEELKQKREDAIEYLEKMKIDTNNKISILEKEIKLKENIITQLNNNLTSVNGEVAKKDTLLKDTVRGITYPHAFEDTLTVAQLEKERETRYAFQEQCAFLGQELFKLETELKQHKILIEEQKNKILERNTSSLASSPKNRVSSFSNFSSPSRSSSSSSVTSSSSDIPSPNLDNSQINILLVENESLRQKYFMSVGRSLKLQTTLNGGFSNISITDLYDEAIRQKLTIEAWPNFISAHLAGLAPPLVFT